MTEENISAIRARLKFSSIEEFSRGYARYISSGGIFIPMAADKLKPVGAVIRFQFLLGDGSTALLGEGKVHQVRTTSQNGSAPVGMLVKFTKLSQTSKRLVDEIVAAKRAQSPDVEEDEHEGEAQQEPGEEEGPEQVPHEETTAPGPEPNDPFGLASGHSSLEEETRAGPSPHDITPTRHLEPQNQPEPLSTADDAPTHNGEILPSFAQGEEGEESEPQTLYPSYGATNVAPPVNPFALRSTTRPGDLSTELMREASGAHPFPSPDPPTREVEEEDASVGAEQEEEDQSAAPPTIRDDAQLDPYALDLFGDLGAASGANEGYDPGLFDPFPAFDGPAARDDEGPADDAPEEPGSKSQNYDETPDEALPPQQEDSEADLFGDYLLDDPPAAPPAAEEEQASSENDESPGVEEGPASEEDAALDQEVDDALFGAVMDALSSATDAPEASEEASEGELLSEAPAPLSEAAQEEAAPQEDEAQEDEAQEAQQPIAPQEPAPEPSASARPKPSSIRLPPPPPSLPGPPSIDAAEQQGSIGDFLPDDADELLGDIFLPGMTGSNPSIFAARPEAPSPQATLDPLSPASSVGESTDSSPELIEPSELKDDDELEEEQIEAGAPPESFTEGNPALSVAPRRKLAQTQSGLEVLAYDESSDFEESLEALSVADDEQDIDLMFDGIFGGTGESEDDVFGDVFSTQSVPAIKLPAANTEGAPAAGSISGVHTLPEPLDEEDAPSQELTSLLDNLEEQDPTMDISKLDLQGPSVSKESATSQTEENESLEQLLATARKDIKELQSKVSEAPLDAPSDAILDDLLDASDLAPPPPEEESPFLPIPELKKKEKRGLFSKLFGKDE